MLKADKILSVPFIGAQTRILLSILFCEHHNHIPIAISKNNWWHLLRLASSNRILLPFCKRLIQYQEILRYPETANLCQKIINLGEMKIELISFTLDKVTESFKKKGIEFLVVKTKRVIPDVLNDIDLLVLKKDYQEAVRLLSLLKQKNGKQWKSKDSKDLFESKSLYKIDLHHQFTWLNGNHQFIDTELAWRNVRSDFLFGVQCKIPNATVEWSLNALNIMFERFHFSINEYFTLISLTPQSDMDLIIRQSQKYQWSNSLFIFRKNFNKINTAIGDNDYNILDSIDKGPNVPVRSSISFPYTYPYKDVVLTYIDQFKQRGIIDFNLMPYNLTYGFLKSIFYAKEKVSMYGDWFPFDQIVFGGKQRYGIKN